MTKLADILFFTAWRRLATRLALTMLLCGAGLWVAQAASSTVAMATDTAASLGEETALAAPTVPGELVLAVPPHLDRVALDALARRYGARVESWVPRLGLALLSTSAGREPQAARALEAEPLVRFATAHRLLARVADIPLDEYWGSQWGMARVSSPAAWDVAWADPSVVVAVLDTGVHLQQWDLATQIWLNPGESAVDPLTGARTCAADIATNGVDDDENGYVDDCYGYDFAASDNYPADEHGHGTFVSGIAAASTNNLDPALARYVGVAGMARQTRIMALRVLDASGRGSAFNIAEAIDYATASGAQIINLSLTFAPTTSPDLPDVQMLRVAVEAAQAANVLVVAASGNEGYSGGVSFPARFDGVLAVGASRRDDSRASFSNYGTRLDLVAPGVEIFSTLWRPGDEAFGYYGGLASTSAGTSFAAPHVAGTAALVRSLRPDLSQADVYELVRRTADDVGDPGWDIYTGWGRLNAQRAVSEAIIGLRLGLVAEPASVIVGQQARLQLSITAPAGDPAGWGARVALSSSEPAGRAAAGPNDALVPVMLTVDSAGQAETFFTAGMITGTAYVTATLGSISVSLPITITPEPPNEPAAVTVEALPVQISVGDEVALARATAQDREGNPVADGTVVTFTTDLGALRAAGDLEAITGTLFVTGTLSGVAEAALVSRQVAGTAEVRATINAEVTQAVFVRIIPGPAARLTLGAAPDRARAGSRVALSAQVADQYGNDVADGTPVNFVVDAGQLDEAIILTQDGLALIWLTLPDQAGSVQVEASAGDAADLFTVVVLRTIFLPLALQ